MLKENFLGNFLGSRRYLVRFTGIIFVKIWVSYKLRKMGKIDIEITSKSH